VKDSFAAYGDEISHNADVHDRKMVESGGPKESDLSAWADTWMESAPVEKSLAALLGSTVQLMSTDTRFQQAVTIFTLQALSKALTDISEIQRLAAAGSDSSGDEGLITPIKTESGAFAPAA
jgi:hypothetical protein